MWPTSFPRPYRVLFFAMATLVLGACSSDTWLGASDDTSLEGDRIAVLVGLKKAEITDNRTAEVTLPPARDNDSWPQAGGNSTHAMQHVQINTTPKQVWTVSLTTGSSKRNRLLSGPVIAENIVFAIDADATVSAFTLDKGSRLWSVATTPKHERGGALRGGGLGYANGTLFVTTGFADVIALKAQTGEELWRRNVGAPIRMAPAISGGRVIIVTLDNKAMALAENDGRILWTHAEQEQPAVILSSAAPAIENDVAIIPFSTGDIVALRADSGAELWRDAILVVRRTDAAGTLSNTGTSPVIDGNRVYAISQSGLIVAIDMRSGNRIWDLPFSGANMVWSAGDILYFLTSESRLVAVNARTGRPWWETALPLWKDPEDKTGHVEWAGPVLASNRLIVTGSTNEVWFLDPYNGAVLEKFSLPGPVLLPPAIANGTLVTLTESGSLVAYR